MNIISCDVGWKRETKRNAIAVVTGSGQVDFLTSGLDDDHLVSLVREWVEPQSLVLLDVPIEGCEKLEGPRRPIENALQHYVSLYPTSRAGKRGKQLKEKLLRPCLLRQEEVLLSKRYILMLSTNFFGLPRKKAGWRRFGNGESSRAS